MYKNIWKKGIVLLFVFQITYSNAQITFSSRVKYSGSASPADKSLFLIDFWATWCAPCIHVAGYLGDIQAEYPDQLYVVSLSKENPEVVEKFLKDHYTRLSVAIDYEGKTFETYEVSALPYSVMLNAEGKVVWEGNPSNLTTQEVEKQLNLNKKTVPIYEFISYKQYENEEPTEITFDGSYQLTQTDNKTEDLPLISRNKDITIIEGSLEQIICYLLKINSVQISFSSKKSQQPFQLMIKENSQANEIGIAHQILSDLGFKLASGVKKGDFYTIDFSDTSSFWSNEEIDWGEKNAKFLIDEQQFTADNISISNMVYQLSSLRKVPFVIKKRTQNDLFDWEVHYKFDDLMKSSLQNYGLQLDKIYGNYPFYIVEEK